MNSLGALLSQGLTPYIEYAACIYGQIPEPRPNLSDIISSIWGTFGGGFGGGVPIDGVPITSNPGIEIGIEPRPGPILGEIGSCEIRDIDLNVSHPMNYKGLFVYCH